MSEYKSEDIWKLFKRISDHATCSFCCKILGCKSSSTTGLHRHLINVHHMKRKIKESALVNSDSISKKQRLNTIHQFLPTNKTWKLEEIVSRLAAKDGLSIFAICRSEFIRNSITKEGFLLPKQQSDIMNLIYKYYELKKEEVILNINKMKSENKKFSQSIDEWTSFRNRRYMDVQLNYSDGQSDNLGLVRIHGSCPAKKAIDLVDTKLKSFGLNFDSDIIATTSDGASVMVKFGNLSPAYQQLCYNNAIHLAVQNILYAKQSQYVIEDVSADEADDSDGSNEDFNEGDSETSFVVLNHGNRKFEVIKKIRNIVKIFKNSPVRNTVLQNYVKNIFKNELQLLLDCKTRWNTIEIMIKRFLRIKGPVVSALDDLNLSHLWNNECDDDDALNILKALEPVKIAVEALSRNNANLLTAEGILKFLFNALRVNGSAISTSLLEELKLQISNRRDPVLISLIRFLQDSNRFQIPEDKDDNFFTISSKNEIVKRAKVIMKRLFTNKNNTDNIENKSAALNLNDSQNDDEINIVDIENSNKNSSMEVTVLNQNLEKQLEDSIRETLKPSLAIVDDDFRSLLKEFNIYEATGDLTNNLKQLKDALNVIKPTSTQNERNFSISSNFASKKRGRLSDKSLNALCFLKNYFIKNN